MNWRNWINWISMFLDKNEGGGAPEDKKLPEKPKDEKPPDEKPPDEDPDKKKGTWRGQLHKDLQDNPAFAEMEKLDDLGRAYLDLQNKLEVPEKPEDYELVADVPDDLPDEHKKMIETTAEGWRKLALKFQLTKEQAAELYTLSIASYVDGVKQTEAASKADWDVLKEELGDKYKDSQEIVTRVVSVIGEKGDEPATDLVQRLSKTPDGHRILHYVGEGFIIEKPLRDGAPAPGGGESPAEAEDRQIKEIYPKMDHTTQESAPKAEDDLDDMYSME